MENHLCQASPSGEKVSGEKVSGEWVSEKRTSLALGSPGIQQAVSLKVHNQGYLGLNLCSRVSFGTILHQLSLGDMTYEEGLNILPGMSEMRQFYEKWSKDTTFSGRIPADVKKAMLKTKSKTPLDHSNLHAVAKFFTSISKGKEYKFAVRSWHLNTPTGFELAYSFMKKTKLPLLLSLSYSDFDLKLMNKYSSYTNQVYDMN